MSFRKFVPDGFKKAAVLVMRHDGLKRTIWHQLANLLTLLTMAEAVPYQITPLFSA